MIKAGIQRVLNRMGFEVFRLATHFTAPEMAAMEKVKPFTATSMSRMVGLMDAVKYIVANRIEGAFVECGVWRGGSSMLAAHSLIEAGDTSRELFLFDTFEGSQHRRKTRRRDYRGAVSQGIHRRPSVDSSRHRRYRVG